MDVAADCVQMVPDADPHVYVIVCVKLVLCRVTLMICAVPSVPSATDIVDARGIVVNVPEPEPLMVPMLAPLKVIANCCEKLKSNDFEPSALCLMTVDPLASVFVVLLDIPTLLVPLYVVPFTVTDQFFDAVESIRPLDVATSCIAHDTVLVLFATD